MLYLLDGHLDKAEEVLRQLGQELPNDAGIPNDIGVIRMAAASDPAAWLDALEQFTLALEKQPNLPEAKYNIVLAYRRLRLRKLEANAIREYITSEHDSPWQFSSDNDEAPDAVASLAEEIKTAKPEEIPGIVKDHSADALQVILNYAFDPSLPVPANYASLAQELSDAFADNTAKMAIAALSRSNPEQIVRSRHLVTEGRESYVKGRLEESRRAYAAAKGLAGNSPFDEVWITINEADTLLRSLDYTGAGKAFQKAERASRDHHFQWLQARALSSVGSAAALSGGTIESMSRLEKAIEVYRSIGETRELARPLYFLAGYYFIAASFQKSIRLALEALSISEPNDHFRLTQLHKLISDTLMRMGHLETATKFNEQAAEHAEQLDNPWLIASMRIQLASAYLTVNRNHDAATQLESAEKLLAQMSLGDRDVAEVWLNMTRAQISLQSRNFSAAQSSLERNISFISEHPRINGTRTHFQSRLLLAQAREAQGNLTQAAQDLREAIRIVETHQDDLPEKTLQVTFDQDRRDVYDTAIDFESRHNGCAESWNLTQGYKAKLFLKFVNGSAQRLALADVQKQIPNDIQIVEYATLRDRLLIWVISKDTFQCRSRVIKSFDVQKKVESFLSQLKEREPGPKDSQDLYDLLVEPISQFLDPAKAAAVIPDRYLYRMPFSALQSRKNGKYWVEMQPILESPSVTYLFSGAAKASETRRHVAFGSRRYDAFTNAELKTLQEIEPGTRLREGPEVTKASFLEALRGSTLFYYAGHSAFDMKNALESSILLDGDRPGPNTISASEVMQQRITKNATIILSSCETSLGNSTDGPGMGGLTSAFLAGGAGSVVGSIWPVESASTMELMSGVFRHFVKDGQSIAESLQTAQMQLIHHSPYEHPYYWSGFVVTGNLSAN